MKHNNSKLNKTKFVNATQNLHRAKVAKEDEFYTQMSDIEKELKHYTKNFGGKVVYCNCDDYTVSKFYRYFHLKFAELGLKKLIATCYKREDLFSSVKAVGVEYDGQKETKIELNGDGDFQSGECRSLLQQADIVVTNPPFSLSRKHFAQLVEHDKKFLVIGNINAITYKECFQLVKENKMWLGYNTPRIFEKPDGSLFETSRTFWYTNLTIAKRTEELVLYKKYTAEEYPTYDNYNAIEVGRTEEIPMDYDGAIGVPITFLDKYNPEQFEIIGQMATTKATEFNLGYPYLKGKKVYARIIIRRLK